MKNRRRWLWAVAVLLALAWLAYGHYANIDNPFCTHPATRMHCPPP